MEEDSKYEVRQLLTKAQGHRSLRQFADVLDINVSSLTRMRNGQINPRHELIARIVENAEERITFEELCDAFERITESRKTDAQIQEEQKQNQNGQKAVITMGLLVRGYSIKVCEPLLGRVSNSLVDLELLTDALGSGNQGIWAFSFVGMPQNDLSEKYSSTSIMRINTHLNNMAASYYLGTATYSRYSIVTTDRYAFSLLEEKWSTLCIKDEISLILVDLLEKEILNEFVIPNANGKIPAYPFLR